ncbi:nucleoporin NUP188 isoform X2 [Hemiscyllium ocellatum]|uniref:nucleoporin NUP188 isoform X2 n=1 Tax=Hemiscyllium ocellatum TaxID=170820 RepID=UPI0029676E6B|nr:nucleoporin NUP188 isoform X2 [Hemiscyllium ocellatum]
MAVAVARTYVRSSRELWTILLGRSALRENDQIEAELDRHCERLLAGLSYYKPPSISSGEKLKADKEVVVPLKELGLRISKFLSLDEQQSVQLLQSYLQEDYRGTQSSIKVVLQDERQSQALQLKIAEYYYEERLYTLRCVLYLLTYFQDERHPYRAEYSKCVDKLEKELVVNYRKQFEELFRTEAPTWETHGNLMTERQVSRWFVQCLKEQALILEIIFLYYAYFEMGPEDLLAFARIFKEQGFGTRQTNRHLVDESMDGMVDRIGYFSALILVEGMDIDFLHKCALEERVEQHQFANAREICQEMDKLLLTLGDIPHHAQVLLSWALLRHTLNLDESTPVIRRLGSTAIQQNVFQLMTQMLKALGSGGNNCTASTARMCIYGLLSFVLTSFEEETLGNQQHLIDVACEVFTAPNLAELFWDTEPTAGIAILLDNNCGMFPQSMAPLLQLLSALISDKSTAKKVYSFLDKMTCYTEPYKHKPHDVLSHEDGTRWRRQMPKLLYPLGSGQANIRMPQGTYGHVIPAGQGFLVRWDFSYSSWTVFTCEIEMLLHVVSTADVLLHCRKVKPIIDLVHKIISTDWSITDYLLPITSRLYMLIQRLSSVLNPPTDVIASCVNTLTVLATRMPAKVWADLQHTGFLPYSVTQVTGIAQSLRAEGMQAGSYGNLLLSIERPQGEYSVTMAFLRLVTTLVKGQLGSTQSRGLLPCVVFVLKELLPTYHKWRYNVYGVREEIGCLIFELIYTILHLNPAEESQGSNSLSLQSLCTHCLANTEAGQAIINIMAVGVDTIDAVMAVQPNSCGSEGSGQTLIQTIKLAFSITNNVIKLKPSSEVVSPLEQALTQHGTHGNNLIAVLAKYIYHRHDPALPRLAIQLLKRLAMVAPMSVYACLGSDAAAIRDAFLNRLQSKTEDMRIKVMILEFLTVAVETQPGLIELFLNLEVKDDAVGSKEFILGEWSCLQVVLEFIDSKQQGKYWCPPLIHRAAIAFLHALWQDRRDSAMTVLRAKDQFWENLTSVLFGELPAPCNITEKSVLETCAFTLKIICLEIYYVVRGSLDQSLKRTLKMFFEKKRYEYWSEYIKSLVIHMMETETEGAAPFLEFHMIISAWRMVLVLATNYVEVMHLCDNSLRLQLLQDVLEGTKVLLLVPSSASCLRMGSMLATLLLILLKQWKSIIVQVSKILDPLDQILESLSQSNQYFMEKTKAKIFSAIITTLQIKRLRVSDISQYSQMLLTVCETIHNEAIVLFDQTHHALTTGDAGLSDDKDCMETDCAPRLHHKDQKDGVCVLALHLSKELYEMDESGNHLFLITRKVPFLPAMLSTLELSLRVKQNLHFAEASLHLLLVLSRTQQGAAIVAGAGVLPSICLPLLSVYQLSTNGTAQTLGSSRKSLDAPSWPGVYRLTMSLMERLLKSLRYNFLSEALDFVGVHQERILQCLDAVRKVQSLACLDEVDHTVGFILQLSNFIKEWRFHLPQLLRDVQVNLCYLCQTCTFLLHSPKVLQHYLQVKNGDTIPSAILPRQPKSIQTPTKQQNTEKEEIEQRALLKVQSSLLRILSKTLAAVRHFTPDLSQILLDQSLDLAEYDMLFVLSFTTPAFDSDVAPSFGTLLATVNVVLNMQGEIDKKKEPVSLNVGPLTSTEEAKSLKSLLMFTMENCFYVLISQAVRYLKDPSVHSRDKQRMKQELSSELSTVLSSISRYSRRGTPCSPAAALLMSPASKSTCSVSKLSPENQEPLIQLVQAFVRQIQR